MQTTSSTELTAAQFDHIEEFLDSVDAAIGLEELDGFFCALIAGPDTVMPSEYLPHLFGGEMPEFESPAQASEIVGLLMQHWNHIAATLLRDEFYFPILFEDESGKCQGNDWAHGYMLGVELRREGWSRLIDDAKNGGLIIPTMALHFEHDDDPELRPDPIDDKNREDIIAHMTASILGIYRFFVPQRRQGEAQPAQHQHSKLYNLIRS